MARVLSSSLRRFNALAAFRAHFQYDSARSDYHKGVHTRDLRSATLPSFPSTSHNFLVSTIHWITGGEDSEPMVGEWYLQSGNALHEEHQSIMYQMVGCWGELSLTWGVVERFCGTAERSLGSPDFLSCPLIAGSLTHIFRDISKTFFEHHHSIEQHHHQTLLCFHQ